MCEFDLEQFGRLDIHRKLDFLEGWRDQLPEETLLLFREQVVSQRMQLSEQNLDNTNLALRLYRQMFRAFYDLVPDLKSGVRGIGNNALDIPLNATEDMQAKVGIGGTNNRDELRLQVDLTFGKDGTPPPVDLVQTEKYFRGRISQLACALNFHTEQYTPTKNQCIRIFRTVDPKQPAASRIDVIQFEDRNPSTFGRTLGKENEIGPSTFNPGTLLFEDSDGNTCAFSNQALFNTYVLLDKVREGLTTHLALPEPLK